MKTLVLYYSQSVGNTEKIAKILEEKLNADLERIDTVVPYTGTYEEITEQGHVEVNKGYKPEIKPINSDLKTYETVVIATPTWWYTMAPAILTLLSKISLKGKKVILVQTHAGWPGHCLADMEKLCQDSQIISKKEIQFDSNGGSEMITSISDIEKWIEELKGDEENE